MTTDLKQKQTNKTTGCLTILTCKLYFSFMFLSISVCEYYFVRQFEILHDSFYNLTLNCWNKHCFLFNLVLCFVMVRDHILSRWMHSSKYSSFLLPQLVTILSASFEKKKLSGLLNIVSTCTSCNNSCMWTDTEVKHKNIPKMQN